MRSFALVMLLSCEPRATAYEMPAVLLPEASLFAMEAIAPLPPETSGYRVGDAIDVEWKSTWWAAHVIEIVDLHPPTYRIHYDGWGDEWDEEVGMDRIRKRSE